MPHPPLTFVTVPRSFEDTTGIRQRNAIRSWAQQIPPCPILVFGDDPGVSDVAGKLGAQHVPGIATTEFGTPRIDAVLRAASDLAQTDQICFVNTDIVLLPGFVEVAASVGAWSTDYLLIGRRRNLDQHTAMSFDPGWDSELIQRLKREGILGTGHYLDYFVFPRGAFTDLPPLAVGRVQWDKWMLFSARGRGTPIIDATDGILIMHQDHDYEHVAGSAGQFAVGPEHDMNRASLAAADPSFKPHLQTTLSATHVLTEDGAVRRAPLLRRVRWRRHMWLQGSPRLVRLQQKVRAIVSHIPGARCWGRLLKR